VTHSIPLCFVVLNSVSRTCDFPTTTATGL
jgi:hypothetical protein